MKPDNFFWLTFVMMVYHLTKQCDSCWKMKPFTDKLVSNKPCFSHYIFFATVSRVLQENKKSVTFTVLSVLIGWSTRHVLATGDVSTSAGWDRPVYSAATFPATILSQFKPDLKERATTNEIDLDLLYCHSTNTPSVHIWNEISLPWLTVEWTHKLSKIQYSQNIKCWYDLKKLKLLSV